MKTISWGALLLSLTLMTAPATAQGSTKGSGNPFEQSKFVPDISLIVDVSAAYRNFLDSRYEQFAIPGFSSPYADNPAEELEGMNGRRGFNFNYGELVLYSVVDPYFDLFGVFTLNEDEFGVEEAYFTTRFLPYGLKVKGGKFLSHFGRINEQHTHYWDFANAPLVHNVFFGESMLNDKGFRLTWVPPTDFYLLFGGEIMQGENAMSYGHDGIANPAGDTVIEEAGGPNMFVAYVKTSLDVGNLTILGGVSNAYGSTRSNHGLDVAGEPGEAVSGDTNVLGGDLTFKYMFDSIRYVSIQGEYVYRHFNGRQYTKDETDTVSDQALKRRQGGLYAQVVGRLTKRWRMGGRLDLLHLNNIYLEHIKQDHPSNLPRFTTMLEYNPTEFSRLRLQYSYDRSRFELLSAGDLRRPTHELVFQINLAIGAHGAHAF
ncbi:MAG: hypothetical protein JXQ27_05590 [Acidobacteria bacterium]|nr:hypothetical protein [Acidobacteriota bacterium]